MKGPAAATGPMPGIKECRAEQQAPKSTPEEAGPSPGLHPVTGRIEPDRPFFGVIALADDRQLAQWETVGLHGLHQLFRLFVRIEHADGGLFEGTRVGRSLGFRSGIVEINRWLRV